MMVCVSHRDIRKLMVLAVLVLGLVASPAASGSAVPATADAPGWQVAPGTYPSQIPPGGKGYILLPIYNIGGSNSNGPVTVTDKLPAGLTAIEAGYYGGNIPDHKSQVLLWKCETGQVVTCVNDPENLPWIPPGEVYYLEIVVHAAGDASGTELNEVTVSGGGAPVPAVLSDPIKFGPEESGFGLQSLDSWFSDADGTLDHQAGSHPYSLTVAFYLNSTLKGSIGEMRDVVVNLPPGVIGNPQVMPRCTRAELDTNHCPPDTQVGVDLINILQGPKPGTIAEGGGEFLNPQLEVYNMVPPPGVPAEFGFSLLGHGTRLDAAIRSGSDYGISEHVKNIPQLAISFNSITIWGHPSDPSHDYQRCGITESHPGTVCGESVSLGHVPFLTLPTSCKGPEPYTATVAPWETSLGGAISEVGFYTRNYADVPEGLTGCDHLSFTPTIGAGA